ncbi:MAG: hypothetical protein RL748_2099 [Pseudomonadota bacterium]|jgi:hypothetical protein
MKYRRITPTQAPLSELMAAVFADPDSDAALDHFFSVFMESMIGIALIGAPPDMDSLSVVREQDHIGVAFTEAPDGRSMIVACADRSAYSERFDSRFNAELPGRELMELAQQLPDECEGILLYSALVEKSIGISRSEFGRLLANSPRRPPAHLLN